MAELVCLAEGVAELVHDGDTVALEGFTHLIPFAAGHEIIRQGRRDLTLVRMTPDIVYDQLIGAGCARPLVFSWGGNPGVGSLHRFRDAVENGWPRRWRSRSTATPAWPTGTSAGASGLPFAVLRGYVGTDLRRAHRHRRARSPARSPARCSPRSPALNPDVTVIHAQRADRRGNVQTVGHHRRAEGGRAGRPALAGHGRGDRRRARPAPGRGRAAELGRSPRWPRCPAAPTRPTRRATTTATTTTTGPGTPISRDRDTFRAWLDATRDSRGEPAMSWTADEMMTVAAARALAGRHRLLRRHRPAQHRGQPGPPHARTRTWC